LVWLVLAASGVVAVIKWANSLASIAEFAEIGGAVKDLRLPRYKAMVANG
jgi:hypothetical protein